MLYQSIGLDVIIFFWDKYKSNVYSEHIEKIKFQYNTWRKGNYNGSGLPYNNIMFSHLKPFGELIKPDLSELRRKYTIPLGNLQKTVSINEVILY
jgi:hypothetical protein